METKYRVKLDLTIYADTWEEAQRCAAGALASCHEDGSFQHIHGIGLARGYISFREELPSPAPADREKP